MTNTIQTMPWPEAVAFYEHLDAARGNASSPLTAFAKFIASSRYADGMFPSISGETLCIGRTPDFTSGKDELRIGFDADNNAFLFVHAQRPDETHPWSLSCSIAELESTFERIVHKRLRWFHEG